MAAGPALPPVQPLDLDASGRHQLQLGALSLRNAGPVALGLGGLWSDEGGDPGDVAGCDLLQCSWA